MSTNVPPSGGQSPVTTDDRATLLPAGWVREATDDDTKAKSSIVDANREVYTITDESLPSHMRSLLPSHEQHVHDLLSLERTRKRLRYVIICLTVMLALTVLVAVTLVFSLKVKPMAGIAEGSRNKISSSPAVDTQMTAVETEVKIALLGGRNRRPKWAVYRHTGPAERRTPCVTECWSYAAFRFRSVCDDGYCRCQGQNYDTNTCLPKFHDCQIERGAPNKGAARLMGTNQTTYSCQAPPHASSSIHVASIFGNHQSSTTHVTVTSSSPSSKVLVLVNYHFVKWTVHLPRNSGISKVFVVSMKRFRQPDRVTFVPGSADDPEVLHRLSLTGYGQDKNGGHTPQLLEFVEKNVGPITSFLGASHADELTLSLDDDKESSTTTITTTTTSDVESTTQ